MVPRHGITTIFGSGFHKNKLIRLLKLQIQMKCVNLFNANIIVQKEFVIAPTSHPTTQVVIVTANR